MSYQLWISLTHFVSSDIDLTFVTFPSESGFGNASKQTGLKLKFRVMLYIIKSSISLLVVVNGVAANFHLKVSNLQILRICLCLKAETVIKEIFWYDWSLYHIALIIDYY